MSDPPARRKVQGTAKSTGGNRSISDFVTSNGGPEGTSHGVDVVMNEDGTMRVAAGDGSEDGDDEDD
jgi:hypothetical protein